MIDIRFLILKNVCTDVYLTAPGDGFTVPNVFHRSIGAHAIFKDGTVAEFEARNVQQLVNDIYTEGVRRRDGLSGMFGNDPRKTN